MSSDPASKPSNSLRPVAIAIALLSVAFAVGLGVLIFYMVRPRGERVGETSLTDPLAALMVDGKHGDSLVFRVDASVRLPRISVVGDDELERRVSRQLTRSILTVRAAPASGPERTATCAVYKGRATSTTTTPASLSRAGMLNDCVILLDQTGPWRVRASVAWASDLALASATLETRREATK